MVNAAVYSAQQLELFGEYERPRGGRYPRYFVWENVPGAFSGNKGADFRAVLEEIGQSEIPMPPNGKWADAGMAELPKCQIAWRVLDAQYFGVPQRRRRIFLVADFAVSGRCAGEILFERESVSGNPQESKGAGEGSTRGAENCARTSGLVYGFDTRASIASSAPVIADGTPPLTASNRLGVVTTIYDMTHADEVMRPVKDGIVPTLRASGGNHGGGSENLAVMHSIVRRLTPTECERLQGLEDGYTDGGSDTARYKALGNGMAQPCADYVIRRIVECVQAERTEEHDG